MFESLKNVPRLLLEQELRPIQGHRFQPTGFADLGAADYRLHDGRRMLLVESAQSVANHLEQTCLNGSGPDIAPELDGLPYVKAKLEGASDAETSSLIEAHRINSPFIISDPGFQTAFLTLSGYKRGSPSIGKRRRRRCSTSTRMRFFTAFSWLICSTDGCGFLV